MMDIVEALRWTAVHGDQEQAIVVMEAAAKEIVRLREMLEEDEPYVGPMSPADLVCNVTPVETPFMRRK